MGNDTLFHQALTLEHEGRFAEALKLFERCCADPAFDQGDLLFHCAWCLENSKDQQQAVMMYEKASAVTRIPSVRLNGYFRIGWVLMHEKEYVHAADAFRNAADYGDLVRMYNETYMHAIFWYAHCLELMGRYLEALPWYRKVQSLCAHLEPESRLRQIMCLNHIGQFDEALNVCRTFDAAVPGEFDRLRYQTIHNEVLKERGVLEACLIPFHAEGRG